MNGINNTNGRAPSPARLTNKLVNKEGKWLFPGDRGVRREISRRLKPIASWVATCALLFSPCVPVHGGWLKADVDFSKQAIPTRQLALQPG
jgi:hypothetical protein